jgi:hypothetical protein
MSRSSDGKALKLGAVAYDPKVITIWEVSSRTSQNTARRSITFCIRNTTHRLKPIYRERSTSRGIHLWPG